MTQPTAQHATQARYAERFLHRYDQWALEREALSAAEETGDTPRPNDWEGSDDVGIEHLHEAADIIRDLLGLAPYARPRADDQSKGDATRDLVQRLTDEVVDLKAAMLERPPSAATLINRYGAPDDISASDDVTNLDRVGWARGALGLFVNMVAPSYSEGDLDHPDVVEEQGGDLITDLLHLATYSGGDAEAMHEQGMRHFLAEVGRGYTDGD